MLLQSWATVYDDGTTLQQHWLTCLRVSRDIFDDIYIIMYQSGPIFSYKLRYIGLYSVVQVLIYRNLYENTLIDIYDISSVVREYGP